MGGTVTRCPNGNECPEGEFCYIDFVCAQASDQAAETTESFAAGQIHEMVSFPSSASANANPNEDFDAPDEGFNAWYNDRIYSGASVVTTSIEFFLLSIAAGLF